MDKDQAPDRKPLQTPPPDLEMDAAIKTWTPGTPLDVYIMTGRRAAWHRRQATKAKAQDQPRPPTPDPILYRPRLVKR